MISAIVTKKSVWLPETVRSCGIVEKVNFIDHITPYGIIVPREHSLELHKSLIEKPSSLKYLKKECMLTYIRLDGEVRHYIFGCGSITTASRSASDTPYLYPDNDLESSHTCGMINLLLADKAIKMTPRAIIKKYRSRFCVTTQYTEMSYKALDEIYKTTIGRDMSPLPLLLDCLE